MDHRFRGTEDIRPNGEAVPALEKPFLIMYDTDSEATYCLPVASKAVTDYVVYCVKSVIDELGYREVRIALKSDAAPELQQVREQVRNLRTAPTTPIDVPVKESEINGAVERAFMLGRDNLGQSEIMSRARLLRLTIARWMRSIRYGICAPGVRRRS